MSPLNRFMGQADYRRTMEEMRLRDGVQAGAVFGRAILGDADGGADAHAVPFLMPQLPERGGAPQRRSLEEIEAHWHYLRHSGAIRHLLEEKYSRFFLDLLKEPAKVLLCGPGIQTGLQFKEHNHTILGLLK